MTLVPQSGMIVKSNSLVEARYRLSTGAQRLLATLISCIDRSDEDFRPYRISVMDLALLFDITGVKGSHLYEQVEKAASELVDKKFSVRDGKSWLHTRWLSSAKYIEGEGSVQLRFDPEMKPYLLELKRCFTQYQLARVIPFRGAYSSRVYEMLKMEQFKSTADGIFNKTFEVQPLREMLELETEYTNFGDFRRYVVEQAVREINKHSDLYVHSVDYQKQGRSIARFVATVGPNLANIAKAEEAAAAALKNVQREIPLEMPGLEVDGASTIVSLNPRMDERLAPLVSHGFQEANIRKWVDKYGVDRVLRTMDYFLDRKTKVQQGKLAPISNGYFVSALEGDYGLNAVAAKQHENEMKIAAGADAAAAKKADKEREQLIKSAAEECLSLFAALPELEREQHRLAFREKLVPMQHALWDTVFESHRMFKVSFARFLTLQGIGTDEAMRVLAQ